jgi:outer membrane protein assembly factor BamA
MKIFQSSSLLLRFKNTFLLGLVVLFFFTACRPTKHLEEGELLLTNITIETKGKAKFNDDLKSISKQQPNRKLLGIFRLYLGIHNLFYNKEDSKIKDKLGESPVIYDSSLTQPSIDLMHRFLKNKGYYENEVSIEADTQKRWFSVKPLNKVKLKFKINKGKEYLIASLNQTITDPSINKIVANAKNKSALNVYDPFNLDDLQYERLRIERLMKNNGYYEFSREYILFEADTSQKTKSASITVKIKNPTFNYFNTDSLIEGNHKTFQIKNVYVSMELPGGTVVTEDTTYSDNMIFIGLAGKYKEKAISRITYLRPGQLFSLKNQEETYRNLSSLRVFSYVNIQYTPDYYSNGKGLNAIITVRPRKQKSITIETEGTNNGGNLGINGAINFQNNNTFKGAEILNISMSGGLEAQTIFTDEEQRQIGNGTLPFNTLEFGPKASLEVPRFLLPFVSNKVSPKGNPRTSFNASYNLQDRPDYRRNVTKTYVSYTWNESPTKTHVVQPFDLSYIKLDPSESFLTVLNNIQNPFLKNSYTDNFILASKYSFILNTQNSNNLKNHIYFRGNIETAGNLLAASSNTWNSNTNDDGSRNIGGIRFAQYVRADVDFRYYQKFNWNKIVYRFASGLGLPYGNSIAMPFEKSFYAGGANGIRAWRARELGPGNLADSIERNVDQIGNVSLEGNVEWRIPVTSILEGALFVDAGNIWNYQQKGTRDETEFQFDRLWDGTAIGFGIGLRLNFSFFILRFDGATKLKDPSSEKPNDFNPQWGDTNLNLGIGYPF